MNRIEKIENWFRTMQWFRRSGKAVAEGFQRPAGKTERENNLEFELARALDEREQMMRRFCENSRHLEDARVRVHQVEDRNRELENDLTCARAELVLERRKKRRKK